MLTAVRILAGAVVVALGIGLWRSTNEEGGGLWVALGIDPSSSRPRLRAVAASIWLLGLVTVVTAPI